MPIPIMLLRLKPMPRIASGHQQLADASIQRRIDASDRPDRVQRSENGPAQGRHRLRRIAQRRQHRHFADRQAALLDQEQRQPGEQEIEAIIAGGVADPHRPQRPFVEQAANRHHRLASLLHDPPAARQQPAATAPARSASTRPKAMNIARQPSDGEDHPTGQRADRRAERNADRDGRIGHAAPLRGNMPGDNLGAAGKGDAFADAQHDPQHQQRQRSRRRIPSAACWLPTGSRPSAISR